jgi:hypothetical protein
MNIFSQTQIARTGLSYGVGAPWISSNCVTYNDGITFALCNSFPANGSTTAYLVGYNFDFNIPNRAIITGTQVSFQRFSEDDSAVIFTTSVQLWLGSLLGINYNPANQWSTFLSDDIAGNSAFLWNLDLTPNFINQYGFGLAVALRCDTEAAQLYAQNFAATVFYSLNSPLVQALQDSNGFIWSITVNNQEQLQLVNTGRGSTAAVYLNDAMNTTSWLISSSNGQLEMTLVPFSGSYPMKIMLLGVNGANYDLGLQLLGIEPVFTLTLV